MLGLFMVFAWQAYAFSPGPSLSPLMPPVSSSDCPQPEIIHALIGIVWLIVLLLPLVTAHLATITSSSYEAGGKKITKQQKLAWIGLPTLVIYSFLVFLVCQIPRNNIFGFIGVISDAPSKLALYLITAGILEAATLTYLLYRVGSAHSGLASIKASLKITAITTLAVFGVAAIIYVIGKPILFHNLSYCG